MLSQNVNPTERAMIRTIRATRMATQMMIYTNFYNAKHHNHSHHISIIVIIIIIIIIIIVYRHHRSKCYQLFTLQVTIQQHCRIRKNTNPLLIPPVTVRFSRVSKIWLGLVSRNRVSFNSSNYEYCYQFFNSAHNYQQ